MKFKEDEEISCHHCVYVDSYFILEIMCCEKAASFKG